MKELAKIFAIKDLGDIRYCLRIEIHQTRERIRLSQAGYIRDILDRFGMTDCKPVRTPLETGLKLCQADDDSDERPVSGIGLADVSGARNSRYRSCSECT